MDAGDLLVDRLALLMSDPDVAVRTEAATVLGTCRRAEAMEPLQLAEEDVSLCVREAAARSLEQIVDRASTKSAPMSCPREVNCDVRAV